MSTEVHAQLSRIERALGRLEGDAAAIRKSLDAREADHAALAGRVGKLENGQSYAAGAAGIIGWIAGLVGGAIATWLGRHFA